MLCRALDIARRQSARSLELRAVMSMVHLWKNQERKVEARQMLERIYGAFGEGLDTADLQAAKMLIADSS